jgi:hypothetical protein
LWSSLDKLFGWNFGEGGGPGLPKGWQAVVLSLATTLPLVSLPPACELIFKKHIVLPFHYRASFIMIFTAALGHVLLYGTKTPRIRGFRDRIFPQNNQLNFWKATQMEAVYTIVHFFSTVFVYQIVIQQQTFAGLWTALTNTAVSGFIFFFGACTYIAVRYPASLVPIPVTLPDGSIWPDNRWVAMRAVVNGAILMAAFMIGILI